MKLNEIGSLLGNKNNDITLLHVSFGITIF
jgi:hypothetical protein